MSYANPYDKLPDLSEGLDLELDLLFKFVKTSKNKSALVKGLESVIESGWTLTLRPPSSPSGANGTSKGDDGVFQ